MHAIKFKIPWGKSRLWMIIRSFWGIIDQCCTNLSMGMQDGSRAQTLDQKNQMNQKYPIKSLKCGNWKVKLWGTLEFSNLRGLKILLSSHFTSFSSFLIAVRWSQQMIRSMACYRKEHCSDHNSTPLAQRSCLSKIHASCGPVTKSEKGLPEILQAIEELFAMRS